MEPDTLYPWPRSFPTLLVQFLSPLHPPSKEMDPSFAVLAALLLDGFNLSPYK